MHILLDVMGEEREQKEFEIMMNKKYGYIPPDHWWIRLEKFIFKLIRERGINV